VLAFINLSKLHPNQWMQNYLSKHCPILIALFTSRTSVAFRCFKSLENLIGLTGKSISFETILKASMAWKAGQLILPRGFSDLILPF
jgi:hypothetical protein